MLEPEDFETEEDRDEYYSEVVLRTINYDITNYNLIGGSKIA